MSLIKKNPSETKLSANTETKLEFRFWRINFSMMIQAFYALSQFFMLLGC